jgi:multidrug transporter EmrE-like cation transporter
MNYIALIILALGGIVLTIGDFFMKKWVVSHNNLTFFIGMFVWIIGLLFLAFSFKYKNIAVASIIFMLLNVISLLLFSWFYFKENLSGFEIAGMILGIIAIILLELGEK